MTALGQGLRMLGFTLGALLNVPLALLLARKPKASAEARLLLAALSAAALWHAANAAWIFHQANVGAESAALAAAANIGLALAPAFLLHLGLIWAKLTSWLSVPGYVAALAIWWMIEMGRPGSAYLSIGLELIAAAALSLLAAMNREIGYQRRFHLLFAASLLLPVATGLFLGFDSALVVLASLVLPLCLVYFIYSYQLLDVLISRRVLFALFLGLVLACYLFAVRRLADFLEDEFEAFAALTEVALIFAAALIWIPLYGWMSRFLSKRTRVYADFSKRLIEDATRILDLEKRLAFLEEEVGRTFQFRRVLLLTAGEPKRSGRSLPDGSGEAAERLPEIERLVRDERPEVVHPSRKAHPRLAALVAETGFNYLFPLWYEEHLTGLLFVDSTPRVFLDEDESILLGLSRQISHSIETCRIVDEKIGLERALARQEHLASLGKVAATIAHEIKNPLSSVKTLAQLMREDPDVLEKYDRDLGYIIGEVDRLNRSVLQLLSFSRPAPEERRAVNLTELLESMAELLERQSANGQVEVSHGVAPGLVMLRGNAEIMRQIVLNLMLNAIQASEPRGQVRMEASTKAARIEITITDRGPGVPAELRERIFEPFFTTKQKGTGLGLAIVRKNVRQLEGELAIESPVEEGRGTRVRVTLPAE